MNFTASSCPPCCRAVLMLVLRSAIRFRSSSSLSTISRIIARLSFDSRSFLSRTRGLSMARVVWSTKPTKSEVTVKSASSFPFSASLLSSSSVFLRKAKKSSVSSGRCLTISYSISLNSVSKKYAMSAACVVGCSRASRAASSSARAFSYSALSASSSFFSMESSFSRSFLSISIDAADSSTSLNSPSGSKFISSASLCASSALSTFLRASLSMARPSEPSSCPAVALSRSAPAPSSWMRCPRRCCKMASDSGSTPPAETRKPRPAARRALGGAVVRLRGARI
mmetsp:Transcript_27682/g.44358  ORF Transcript_27682/g.44358 Transcript_27682/m.44358 type:complete len:283 (-) Transcript_27682:294-1142(-)